MRVNEHACLSTTRGRLIGKRCSYFVLFDGNGVAHVVQAIRSFSEGCRRGLGIVVRCDCGKIATFRCSDFEGFIAPNADIERLTWRCLWCRMTATYVRYTSIDRMDRQDLSQWLPPKGRKRRWPSEEEVRKMG